MAVKTIRPTVAMLAFAVALPTYMRNRYGARKKKLQRDADKQRDFGRRFNGRRKSDQVAEQLMRQHGNA